MPPWTPEKVWDGRDVYIIGGGKSLEHFDWSLLLDKCTIGCNDAYSHGVDICKICFFGDSIWFDDHKENLAKYKGTVFTNAPALYSTRIKWLWTMMRGSSGIHSESLGWNFNSGACSVNLAVLLGAKRVYLLGFDMKLTNGQNNWHPNNLSKPDPDIFEKFIEGFELLKISMDKQYPNIEVINITDDSDLNIYPKIELNDFWEGR